MIGHALRIKGDYVDERSSQAEVFEKYEKDFLFTRNTPLIS